MPTGSAALPHPPFPGVAALSNRVNYWRCKPERLEGVPYRSNIAASPGARTRGSRHPGSRGPGDGNGSSFASSVINSKTLGSSLCDSRFCWVQDFSTQRRDVSVRNNSKVWNEFSARPFRAPCNAGWSSPACGTLLAACLTQTIDPAFLQWIPFLLLSGWVVPCCF